MFDENELIYSRYIGFEIKHRGRVWHVRIFANGMAWNEGGDLAGLEQAGPAGFKGGVCFVPSAIAGSLADLEAVGLTLPDEIVDLLRKTADRDLDRMCYFARQAGASGRKARDFLRSFGLDTDKDERRRRARKWASDNDLPMPPPRRGRPKEPDD